MLELASIGSLRFALTTGRRHGVTGRQQRGSIESDMSLVEQIRKLREEAEVRSECEKRREEEESNRRKADIAAIEAQLKELHVGCQDIDAVLEESRTKLTEIEVNLNELREHKEKFAENLKQLNKTTQSTEERMKKLDARTERLEKTKNRAGWPTIPELQLALRDQDEAEMLQMPQTEKGTKRRRSS